MEKQLDAAIEALKAAPSIAIHGKNYTQVATRVEVFRKHFGLSLGLTTTVLDSVEPFVRVKAEIIDAEGKVVASGLAEENRNYGNINKTSALENCFHESTEVLTTHGWLHINEAVRDFNSGVRCGMLVAAVDLASDHLIFERPNAAIEQKNQEFVLIEDNLTRQIVTLNHRVLIGRGDSIEAADLLRRQKAANRPQGHKIRQDFIIDGDGLGDGTPNFARLLQWVIADGYIDYQYSHIKFGFAKHRKVARLIGLLNEMGREYSTSISKCGKIIRVNLKRAVDLCEVLFGGKTLTTEMALAMNAGQASAFISEIEFTDGTRHSRGGIYLRQTDFRYHENVCLLAAGCGYDIGSMRTNEKPALGTFPNAKPIHRVNFKSNTRRMVTTATKLQERGTAFCFSMPSGTLITRNEGKITVCFNCETSAIGRALAAFGLHGGEYASAGEVGNAIAQQEVAWKGPLNKTALKKRMRELSTAIQEAKLAEDVDIVADSFKPELEQAYHDLRDWWDGAQEALVTRKDSLRNMEAA